MYVYSAYLISNIFHGKSQNLFLRRAVALTANEKLLRIQIYRKAPSKGKKIRNNTFEDDENDPSFIYYRFGAKPLWIKINTIH